MVYPLLDGFLDGLRGARINILAINDHIIAKYGSNLLKRFPSCLEGEVWSVLEFHCSDPSKTLPRERRLQR